MWQVAPTSTTRSSATALAGGLLEQVGALRRGLRRATEAPWPGRQFTGAQLELLRLVRRQPGLSVREAATQLRLKPNTVSTLVKQLTEAGVMVRTRDSEDGRVARLALTADTQRWIAAWRDERVRTLAQALRGLEPEGRDALEAALAPLERLVEALDGGDAHA
jgi:DNA-binding MarR family transcriptional regulator